MYGILYQVSIGGGAATLGLPLHIDAVHFDLIAFTTV